MEFATEILPLFSPQSHRFLVSADSFGSLALAYRIGESTARQIIKGVCEVFVSVLGPLYLQTPNNENLEEASGGFWELWNVPNCYGALDGKHIHIQCPPNSGSLYFNYKKTFSVVLMAACDHLYRTTLVDIGAYRGNSDGGVFADSAIGKRMNNGTLGLPEGVRLLPGSSTMSTPGFMLADDAFQLTPRIMKPFSGRNLPEKWTICNDRFSRARRVIENTFGILSSRFRLLRRNISTLPRTADYFVTSIVILNNLIFIHEPSAAAQHHQNNKAVDESDEEPAHWDPPPLNHNIKVRDVPAAIRQRELLSDYFITPEGEVPWQYEYINRG